VSGRGREQERGKAEEREEEEGGRKKDEREGGRKKGRRKKGGRKRGGGECALLASGSVLVSSARVTRERDISTGFSPSASE